MPTVSGPPSRPSRVRPSGRSGSSKAPGTTSRPSSITAVEQVHRRRADEGRDEGVARRVVDRVRRADLHQPALVQHPDPVAHRHRLDLVVGDEEEGGAERALQVLQLRAQHLAQLGVEVRQRLVHQEHRRVAHDGAADRDPLHLAAGELVGLALEQVLDAQHLRRPRDPPLDLVGGEVAHLRLAAGTPGSAAPCSAGRASSTGRPAPRRAAPRSSRSASSPPMLIAPGVGQLEPGDQPQRRGLAGAGRPEQHEELAVGDGQRQVVDRRDGAEALGDAVAGRSQAMARAGCRSDVAAGGVEEMHLARRRAAPRPGRRGCRRSRWRCAPSGSARRP